MNVNFIPAYQYNNDGNYFVHYDGNTCRVGYSICSINGVDSNDNRMSECFSRTSDIRMCSLSNDENDLINNFAEKISSFSISQKPGVARKGNRGNILKVRLKDSDTALGNRKVINVRFMDSERDVETTIKGTFNQRVDKNFVKRGNATRKPRGKTQGVFKKD